MSESPLGSTKTDEAGATPVPANDPVKSDGREFLAATHRKLTLEEAASAAGIQWFQYEIRRLDRETEKLQTEVSGLRAKNDLLVAELADRRVEVEKLKGAANLSKRNEILATLALAAGAAGLGAVPGYLSVPAAHELAIIGFWISAVLVFAGIVLRMWK